MSELELAERALAHVRGPAQVTVARERSLVSRFARSQPTQATGIDRTNVEVTVVRGGQVGSATTTALDGDALRAAAARATRIAEATARAAGEGVYPGLPRPQEPAGRAGVARWDARTAELDPARAGRALATAFAEAAAHGLQAHGVWTAGEVVTAIASTTGTRLADRVTDAHLKVIARDGGGRSGYGAQTAVSVGELDPAAIARHACQRAPAGERAALPPGEYPVVLDAEAVGLLLEFTAWLACNGLAHAEARGAFAGRLGDAVAAPAITLADDPQATLPRAFDAEGVAKRRTLLIEDGVARAVVHDTRSAALAGADAASTGHAARPGGSAYGPHPAHLALAPGSARDLAELARPIDRGLLVTRLWYVNTVRPKETLLTGMTRDGTFLIEDGEITRPLQDVRFTDAGLRILAATEALGVRDRLVTEAELYGRRDLTATRCPPLRAQGFRVTGGARS